MNTIGYIRFLFIMKWFIVVIFFCLAMIVACSSRKPQADFDFSKLMGSWASISGEASQMEEWEVRNDSNFVGKGYVLERGDTTFFESLEIRKQSGVWTYFAKVHQTQAAEVVPFTLTRQTADRVEFTNNQHDFPKKVGYELLSENELQAYIEGPRDGQTIRIIFDFKRNF